MTFGKIRGNIMTGVHSSDSLGEGFSQPFQSQYDFDLDHRQIQQPDRFKPMIVQLAQALKPEDVHNLRFCYKHFLKASGSQMNDALEILENLEENGVFTYNNVAPLVGLLKDIQRHDLVSTVENFQSTLLSQPLSTAEITQPIPVGPRSSLSFPAAIPTQAYGQKLASVAEEETSSLNVHKSEEVALMVAGTYSSTKSLQQLGSVPLSEAHKEASGTPHQPVSHSQPATIRQEAIVHSFPPPQRQNPQTSRPLFQIQDSSTPEKSASVSSLQDITSGLENPPAEVKPKPIVGASISARESLPAVEHSQSIPCCLNTGHPALEPQDPREGASNQMPSERSISSLSMDASTQTLLKGSPFSKQDKWMSKSPLHKFNLDRKKLYSMIGSHDYSCYQGKFKFPVQCENGKGPIISLKVYPFCYDQNSHMSVQVKAKFPSKSRDTIFVTDLCYCTLRIEITPYHLQGAPLTETARLDISLTPGCNEFKGTLEQVLSHIEIFYCRSSTITLHVQVFLICSEMFETVEGEDADAADDGGYVLVKKHQPGDHHHSASGGQT